MIYQGAQQDSLGVWNHWAELHLQVVGFLYSTHCCHWTRRQPDVVVFYCFCWRCCYCCWCWRCCYFCYCCCYCLLLSTILTREAAKCSASVTSWFLDQVKFPMQWLTTKYQRVDFSFLDSCPATEQSVEWVDELTIKDYLLDWKKESKGDDGI